MERTYAYRKVNKACKKIGIQEKIGTHTMRKTFGYHHYHKFKDVVLLQKIFNHYSPSVTLRYIGIDQEEINNSYLNFILFCKKFFYFSNTFFVSNRFYNIHNILLS